MITRNIRKWFMPAVVLLVCMLAIIAVSPVSADDGDTNEPPAIEEVTSLPQTGEVEKEENYPPKDIGENVQSAVEDEQPASQVEAPAPTDELVMEPSPETTVETPAQGLLEEPEQTDPPAEEDPQEVVDALAENNVVLTDETGGALNLGTQAASQAIKAADPYFYVGTTKYSFFYWDGVTGSDPCSGISHCTTSLTPISASLQYMQDNSVTPTDRKLYIEADTYNEGVEVNGAFPGVSGLTGLVGLGSAPEDVTINGYLYIFNMLNGFSISNMRVINSNEANDAAIWMEGNKGTIKLTDVITQATQTDSSGIVIINHNGNVELNRVASNGNAYHGARIENWASTTGTVTINNSEFNDNLQNVTDGAVFDEYYDENLGDYVSDPYYAGLFINSLGKITINGVNASDNIGDGIDAVTPGTLTIKNSLASGNDQGSLVDNWGDGFWTSAGTIVMENISADRNDVRGVFADTNISFSGNKMWFSDNGSTGIHVTTCMENDDGDPFCDNTGAGTVTIKGTLVFHNGYYGLVVNSKGTITLDDLYAANNAYDGVVLDNRLSTTKPGVSVSKMASSNNGWGHEETPGDPDSWVIDTFASGFVINTLGSVSMNTVHAENNTQDGIQIDNSAGTGSVTITSKALDSNSAANNRGNGYTIVSRGAVTVTNLDAVYNGGYGGMINNYTASKPVIVTINTNFPVGEWSSAYEGNGSYGLLVASTGNVVISRISVLNNGASGATIDNLATPAGSTPSTVSISDSYFAQNSSYGLNVVSKGAISLSYVSAYENGNYGASLSNGYAGSTAGITITACETCGNHYVSNSGNGLVLLSNGPVSITNINATNNVGYGLVIDNSSGSGEVLIAISGSFGQSYWDGDFYSFGSSFSLNGGNGLYVHSQGPVSVAVQRAYGNDGSGISIETQGAVSVSSPSANRWAEIIKNENGGLSVTTKANITLVNLVIDSNEQYGAVLNNKIGSGNISITNLSASWNGGTGMNINTSGSVTWKNGSADGNMGRGAYINNFPNLAINGKTVKLTNVRLTSNSETGLYIISMGAVTLTDVEASSNSSHDEWIESGTRVYDNVTNYTNTWLFDGHASEKITVNVNSWYFNPNINIYDSNWNQVFSAWDDNGDGNTTLEFETTDDDVYYIEIRSYSEYDGGRYEMEFYQGDSAPGLWTIVNPQAYGIQVINTSSTNPAVTIKNSNSRWYGNNSAGGVSIQTNGAVTVTNGDFNDTWGNGLYISNASSSGTPAITLTNVNAYNNVMDGFNIFASGATKITTVNASNNVGNGIAIQGVKPATPVTIVLESANNNNNRGITIDVDGAVNISGLSASNIRDISSNQNGGLRVITIGTIRLANLNLNNNESTGVSLNNSAGSGDVSLNNVFVDNNDGDGMSILSQGSVTWNNGSANNNRGYGIYIDNHKPGVLTTAWKPVTLTSINISHNNQTGLDIFSSGEVILTDVNSDNNSIREGTLEYGDQVQDNSDGQEIWYFNGSAGDEITITIEAPYMVPNLQLLDEYWNQLEWVSGDDDTRSATLTYTLPEDGQYIFSITSNQQWGGGQYLLNFFEGAEPSSWNNRYAQVYGIEVNNVTSPNSPVTINYASMQWIGNNSQGGALILSNGAVAVSNAEFNDSWGNGLTINNSTSTGTPGITLTNVNAHSNLGDGVTLLSKGAVVYKIGFAGQNGAFGFSIDNSNGTGSKVTLTSMNADNNSGNGFWINSNGAASLTGVSSYNNGVSGIDLTTSGAVTFKDVDAGGNGDYGTLVSTSSSFTVKKPSQGSNVFNGNGNTGLSVDAGGKITVTKVHSFNNGRWDDEGNITSVADGMMFVNTANVLGTSPVVLTDIWTGENSDDGLRIETASPVTITNIEANNNAGFGVYVDQTAAPDQLEPVVISNSKTDGNSWDGLYVTAGGIVTLDKISGSSNSGSGAVIHSRAGVSMMNTLGANAFGVNGNNGLFINTVGTVTVTGLEVFNNGGEGLSIINTTSGSAANVTLRNIISRVNESNGIGVLSNGIVTLNSSFIYGNGNSGGDGVYIDNHNNININNTTVTGNAHNGIFASTGAGKTLKLTKSSYFGNVRNHDSGDRNLYVDGIIIIA